MSILVSFLVRGERKDSILGSVLQMSRMEVHSKIVSFIGGRFYLASQLPGGTLSASARIGRHAHHFSDNTYSICPKLVISSKALWTCLPLFDKNCTLSNIRERERYRNG